MFASAFARPSRRLMAWLMGCFLLSMAAATVSPVLQSQPVAWICTATGIAPGGNAADEGPAKQGNASQHQGAQCVLCLTLDAPVSAPVRLMPNPALAQALVAAHYAPGAARFRWLAPAPRGPPELA